jgi:hypothetical protein
LREDYSAKELRARARRSKDVNQSRRLLSLAAVRDGMDRGAAAKIDADGVDAPPTASCAKVVVVEDRDERRGARGRS